MHENEWNDLVFKDRHKAYGAYELREHYQQRLLRAFLSALFTFGGLILAGTLLIHGGRQVVQHLVAVKPDTLQNVFRMRIAEKENQPIITNGSMPAHPKSMQPIVVHDPDLNPASLFHEEDTMRVTGPSGRPGSGLPVTGATGGTHPTGGVALSVSHPDTVAWSEVKPLFPGGEEALLKYLTKNLSGSYTEWARQHQAKGMVYIQFVVNTEGIVSNVTILSDRVGYGCAETAVEVVKNMPHWTPGRRKNQPVAVKMILPVEFSEW